MELKRYTLSYVSPSEITPNPRNARIHGTELEFLKNSIREFGFTNPILVDEYFTCIAGHGRLQAAESLELEEVPVIICPFSAEQAQAYGLIDNQLSDMSIWNLDELNEQLGELDELDWDMGNFGFTVPDFEDVINDTPDTEPEKVEVEEPPANVPASENEESLNLIVFCKTQDEKDELEAYLLSKGLSWRPLISND